MFTKKCHIFKRLKLYFALFLASDLMLVYYSVIAKNLRLKTTMITLSRYMVGSKARA